MKTCPQAVNVKARFCADWQDVAFLNFRFDADCLRTEVPYPLDLYKGHAYVSLVAFRTTRIWLRRIGKWSHWVMDTFASHSFLNVRTYVREGGRDGIYFLMEFVDRRCAIPLARAMYDLPYCFSEIDYRLDDEGRCIAGEVTADGVFSFKAEVEGQARVARPGSLEAFLLERYAAFLGRKGKGRRFEIEHARWVFCDLRVDSLDLALLMKRLPWFAKGDFAGGLFSEGVLNVGISRAIGG